MKIKLQIPEEYCSEAKTAINDVLKELNKDNSVIKLDESAIALLGSVMNTYHTAQKMTLEEGIVVRDKKGNALRPHPAVKIMEEASTKIVRLLLEFGMTPARRQKAGKEPDEELSPLEMFAGGKIQKR